MNPPGIVIETEAQLFRDVQLAITQRYGAKAELRAKSNGKGGLAWWIYDRRGQQVLAAESLKHMATSLGVTPRQGPQPKLENKNMELLRLPEAAALSGYSKSRISKAATDKEIKAEHDQHGHLLIERASLLVWAEKLKQNPKTAPRKGRPRAEVAAERQAQRDAGPSQRQGWPIAPRKRKYPRTPSAVEAEGGVMIHCHVSAETRERLDAMIGKLRGTPLQISIERLVDRALANELASLERIIR